VLSRLRLPRRALRSRLSPSVARRRADLAAVLALLGLTVVGTWGFWRAGNNAVGSDAATFYYPWYSLLAQKLTTGDVPLWNPHQFSGAPFAADPQSGWAYLPAMLLFAFLPLVAAAIGFAFFHLLLAGLSLFALARALGMGIPGALLAAVAYEFCGLLYLQTGCCFTYVTVMSWLPLALLGAEMAIRAPRWAERALWWGVSGLALSQVLASWFGQGSYYVLLALGGYVAYRTLLSPPAGGAPSIRGRLMWGVAHGGGVLGFGFALAAVGLFPRLEYTALSNLADGYPEAETEAFSGWSVRDWGALLEPGSSWYAGVFVLALAVSAPFVARRRFAVPYFAALAPCALVLSGHGPTPLHAALYLLPYFERLHPHRPERVMVIFYVAAALLAGAALTELGRRAAREPRLLVPPSLAVLLLGTTSILLPPIDAWPGRAGGWWVPSFLPTEHGWVLLVGPLVALVSVVVLVSAFALTPPRRAAWRGPALLSVALLAFVDLFGAGRATMAEVPGEHGIKAEDLAAYYEPTGAAGFLRSREGAFRYASYAAKESVGVSAPQRFANPSTRALEANNLAMALGLQSVQGYNPVRVSRYGEYVEAMNGLEQNYHQSDLYEGAFDSPLLDLLNVRYVVVPAEVSPNAPPGLDTSSSYREILRRLERAFPTVYEDEQSKVLENPEALPRAWIVHSTRQVRSGQEALELLSTGQVDPRETALLEEEPPQRVSQPDDPSAESASLTEYGADDMELRSTTQAPGLLVLSEVYYPAWKAYVDGRPAPVYVADHLLRAVPVPAGEHTVELRYESQTLWVGMGISLLAYATLLALAIAAAIRRPRKTRERAVRPAG
jgi:Bacterial membrane protein YfhO